MKIAILDVQYVQNTAFPSLVAAASWSASTPELTKILRFPDCEPYVSGQFYKRELPPLLALIERCSYNAEVYVVDSYVWLAGGNPGMGAHLYERLGSGPPVVGIAKTAFLNAPSVEVFRGTSKRPLFVTAAGMPETDAATYVASMYGPDRIPSLVRLADRLAREAAKVPAT